MSEPQTSPLTGLLNTTQETFKKHQWLVMAVVAAVIAGIGYWIYTMFKPSVEKESKTEEPAADEFGQAIEVPQTTNVPETTEAPSAHSTTPRPFSEDTSYGDYVKSHQEEHDAHNSLHKHILPSPNAF